MVYCSLFQEVKLVMHKPTAKMLPIGLLLCFAVLTVHSKNYDIPSTLHKKILTTILRVHNKIYNWIS